MAYLGGVEVVGKNLLEIGCASGYLSFWMEAQGAAVTAFDLDEHQKWDFVPYAALDLAAFHAERKRHLRRLNNAWWLSHRLRNSRARCVYELVYRLNDSVGRFDVVTLGSILIHLRDPFLALERAASVCSSTIVVTDVDWEAIASWRRRTG